MKSVASKTTYRKKIEVAETVDRIPVRLALQFKRPIDVEDSWWVLSWRARISENGPNRRFYFLKKKFWNISTDIALEMMLKMEKRGGLKDEYLDPRPYSNFETIVSSEITTADKAEWLRLLTAPDEDWGFDGCRSRIAKPKILNLLILNSYRGQSCGASKPRAPIS